MARLGESRIDIAPFRLERWQSEWENRVPFNLAESGVHPLNLEELLDARELEALSRVRLGYTRTNGTPELRKAIAAGYPGATGDNVLVTTGTSEATYVGLWRLIEPGDDVVAVLPNYSCRGCWRASAGGSSRCGCARTRRGRSTWRSWTRASRRARG